MRRPQIRYAAGLLCLVFAASGGCNSSQHASEEKNGPGHSHEHEHEGAPKSLHAAVNQLRDMWFDISTAMDRRDPDAAHDALHDVGHVLESMPDLAAETDLPESEWNEVKAAVNKLFDAFGDIDSAFHEKDGDKVAAYESAKATIDEGVATLEAKLALLGEGPSTDDHHHDQHEGHDRGNEKSASEE